MGTSRGIGDSIKSVISIVSVAIMRLKDHPEEFLNAVEMAKDAVGIIVGGANIISEGAEDLLLMAYMITDAVKSMSSRDIGPPVAENHITDIDTALRFVKQSTRGIITTNTIMEEQQYATIIYESVKRSDD